jgi:hypothetical protein
VSSVLVVYSLSLHVLESRQIDSGHHFSFYGAFHSRLLQPRKCMSLRRFRSRHQSHQQPVSSMQVADAPSEVRRSSDLGSVSWKHLGLAALVSYALGICTFLLWSALTALTRPNPRGPNGPKVLKDSEYPPKYGKIPEQTIWFYYNKGWDPMPNRLVDLCVQSFCVTWIRFLIFFMARSKSLFEGLVWLYLYLSMLYLHTHDCI